MKEFLVDFYNFLKVRKIYWMTPIFIVLILFGLLLFLAEGTVVAPFIYTVF